MHHKDTESTEKTRAKETIFFSLCSLSRWFSDYSRRAFHPLHDPGTVQEGRIVGCDMLVALGRATVDSCTLFGRYASPCHAGQHLCLTPARPFAAGEKVCTEHLELSQTREAYRVLACKKAGRWGYEYGLNEHQIVVGRAPLRAALQCPGPGLLGSDLVRLALERGRTARQAVDVLTSLVERHGQGSESDDPRQQDDNAFLIADPREAYAVETAGRHWVYQEIQEVRAVSGIRVVRQDWDRISAGLAAQAIENGRWPADGSKLDFAAALGEEPPTQPLAWRRWGRATVLMQEQNGHIDMSFFRRLLAQVSGKAEAETSRDITGGRSSRAVPVGEPSPLCGFLSQLSKEPSRLPAIWCVVRAGSNPVYLPLWLDGNLPAVLAEQKPSQEGGLWQRLERLRQLLPRDADLAARAAEDFGRFQGRLDQETEEFMLETAARKQRGALADLQRQANLFMEHNLERLEEIVAGLLHEPALVPTMY